MQTHPLGLFIIPDEHLNERLATASRLDVTTAHILAPSGEQRSSRALQELKHALNDAGVETTVMFCGFEGESYASIPTVRETVGLVPEATRAQRLDEAKRISDMAAELGISVTALHVGFIPDAFNTREYGNIVETVGALADHCAGNGQWLHLETGQETVDTLLHFLEDLGRPNVAVNFDPANMILYGTGDPIEAVQRLSDLIRSVHCKDATWSPRPRIEWGKEVPLGEGDVGMERFLVALKEVGYVGPLTIEREIVGEQQLRDIERGVKLLRELRAKIWGE